MSNKISLITVTYNSEKFISSYLKAINNSNDIKGELEIVIVDNHSRDQKALKNKIKKAKVQYPALAIKAYYRQINHGFASSCNYGAKRATGSIYIFLNPDTRITRSTISTLISHKDASNANIIGPKIFRYSNKGIHRTVYNIPSAISSLIEFSNLGKILHINSNFYIDQSTIRSDKYVPGLSGACMCIDSNSYNRLLGFDTDYFMYLEDVDFCKRANNRGMKIVYCPHSEVSHVGGASSQNLHNIHHQAWYNSRITYIRKHHKMAWISLAIYYRIEELLLKTRQYLSQKGFNK